MPPVVLIQTKPASCSRWLIYVNVVQPSALTLGPLTRFGESDEERPSCWLRFRIRNYGSGP